MVSGCFFPPGHFPVIRSVLKGCDLEAAVADYTRTIEIDAKYPRVHAYRGEVYALMGKDQQALDDFNRELEENPLDIYTFAMRAMVLENMKGDPGPGLA